MTNTTTTTAVRRLLLATAALLALGPAQTAHAAPDAQVRADRLHLTVTRGGDRSFDTVLLCDPPRGHAHAAAACADLAAAGGDFTRVPPRADVMCPMIYAPVTARAQGRWDGRRVDRRETYANTCELHARTGSVFTSAG
ncbi:SSI family serine proteinase inhibitor [Streptomyces sp. NPDC026672]|uniref:SSI family serine proteinase inhibitor n=1 Tax=unclassified Streptomyces TaxID=2593676 RepID=UPI003409551C